MDIGKIHRIYFVGIGGIGMSALARYFLCGGYEIAGYDRTSTPLTDKLSSEGCLIHFEDNVERIPEAFRNPGNRNSTMIVYTPAIPDDHGELSFFRHHSYYILKRSELLGLITRASKGIAIAGTHGKTTVSAVIAHLLKQSDLDCSAFLGGISKNYESNLILGKGDLVVMEADEYDRSFLQLNPYFAVITAIDPDHLDIYEDYKHLKKAFISFIDKIKEGGKLLYKKGLDIKRGMPGTIETYTYSLDPGADFHTKNIRTENDFSLFDVITPGDPLQVRFGFPGKMNIENALAAVAVAWLLGIPDEQIRKAMVHFSGVKRRFDFQIRQKDLVYIDDYAHHPEELKACILSVREMFPGKKITGIFQPHLYSRTRDFATGFARSLEMLDELILLEIYPAREMPITGVGSEMIFEQTSMRNKTLCTKNNLLRLVGEKEFEVLLTLGAGDIDQFVQPIRDSLLEKWEG
ncbi:MAG: UDP-N-acetylmuramate--L-alanine ligase [Bacteroidales bacterium]|nr:MAG: UDP-N-acetylmuramate--L-alanine ligase [Bacteroidales bacterium]